MFNAICSKNTMKKHFCNITTSILSGMSIKTYFNSEHIIDKVLYIFIL